MCSIEFKNKISAVINGLTDSQIDKFEIYYNMLIEWNNKMNLTAITDVDDVIKKHFADSVMLSKYIERNAKCIDVGTGAGFPGIPLKIIRDDIEVVLLDSLNKRITFLKELLNKLNIKCECIHSRAEDGARLAEHREKYDVSLSRAVAPANVLCELTVPFVKVGGKCIMFKGPSADEELKNAENALKVLKCSYQINAVNTDWGERRIVILTKNGKTPQAYPRKAGTASKNPL